MGERRGVREAGTGGPRGAPAAGREGSSESHLGEIMKGSEHHGRFSGQLALEQLENATPTASVWRTQLFEYSSETARAKFLRDSLIRDRAPH